MIKTPKSLRLHIAVTGQTNTGKSSFVNYLTGQSVSITSPVPGTTTDVVEKTAELLPLGPVVFLDTAGTNDSSELGQARMEKSRRVLDRTDIMFLVTEAGCWEEHEELLAGQAGEREIPLVIVVNKTDLHNPDSVFLEKMRAHTPHVVCCSTLDEVRREATIAAIKKILIDEAPKDYLQPPPLAEDLVSPGDHAVLIVPIDIEAPKGRLILPQVQTLRALLDAGAAGTVVKEKEYPDLLNRLKNRPDLVICDSQVVDQMVRDTPPDVACTTFSILFARFKGDLAELARGAAAISSLSSGDKVLISEACSHHPMEDDIGRVKIPRWIEEHTGTSLRWNVAAGRDYPQDLEQYKLIIHCGGCMLNRRAMLSRIEQAGEAGVPITNYGTAISAARGVLERVLEPFPEVLQVYRDSIGISTASVG